MRSGPLLICLLTALAATTAASAQSLSPRDGTAWLPIGATPDFIQYSVDPATLAHGDDGLTRIVIRASAAPSPDDTPNTAVARVAVDCAAHTIGVETVDFYREARGYSHSREGTPPGQAAPLDPGQMLVMDHLCGEAR